MISTDVTIIGAGCVGLTAALGLAKKGISVVVLDAAQGLKTLTEPELRVSAISSASENIFKALDVWQHLDHSRSCAYQTMKVWEKDSFGQIEFDATDVGESRLGHIIENNNLRNALITEAQRQSNITLLFDSPVSNIHNSEEHVLLTLSDGTPVMTKLCIAADGANSWVRKQLNTPITFSDYDHHAIVATVKTTEAHDHCARQVMLPDGPLALLPMSEPNTCSIVWSSEPNHVASLLSLNEHDFACAVTAATDSELGVVELVSKRVSYPLTMRYAQQWVNQRVVFMGDAAHTIHPLAGLGMNLGLLDAASLVELLDSGSLTHQSLSRVLRKYQGWRKAEAQNYIAAMAGLKELFSGVNPLKKIIRGIGLSLTNNISPAKTNITQHAMGLKGNIPELARNVDPI
ncbi:MAG: FAD-dependent monooxygenase [Gammaproteobacteria bacterium]|nr:FAD-dependent monooxygenase [Gammaproteobacteria bacterium]